MTDRDEDFLRRWSRRKIEARQGQREKEAVPAPIAEEPPSAARQGVARQGNDPGERDAAGEPADQAVEEPAFDDVDFDKLDFQSDYTRFLKKGVPAAIQRRALRQLWKSDPVLACADGLTDYDFDYTDAATAVKDLKTAWQVGRGFLTDEDLGIESKADKAEGAAEEQASDAAGPDAERASARAEEEARSDRQAAAPPDADDAGAAPADPHDKS